jgi:hypothetical protein
MNRGPVVSSKEPQTTNSDLHKIYNLYRKIIVLIRTGSKNSVHPSIANPRLTS